MTTKFTFVTYDGLPELDADDRLVAAELERRGCKYAVADWRDAQVDWQNSGVCVVRSTWDYHLHYREFLDWTERVSGKTKLLNDSSLIRWNSNKRYLFDLERAGIPIVPTVIFEQNEKANLNAVLQERTWQRAILKPVIGLSTFGVRKIEAHSDDIQSHLDAMLVNSAVLLQPFIETVHARGERALVFIGDDYSHTIRKSAFQPLSDDSVCICQSGHDSGRKWRRSAHGAGVGGTVALSQYVSTGHITLS